jgi:hypothetical protein
MNLDWQTLAFVLGIFAPLNGMSLWAMKWLIKPMALQSLQAL